MSANDVAGPGSAGLRRVRRPALTDAGGLLGEGVGLVFTSRAGGVSPAPFDSLNLAFHTGDDPANVTANRALVAEAIDAPPMDFVYLEQVHGAKVARVSGAEQHGSGAGDALPACDGAFTTVPGLVLSVLTADCVPVAVSYPSGGAVAVVHAGWRGTIADIVAVALRKIREEMGLDPADARAVMGPAIAACCYEVDEGRAGLFVERYGRRDGVVTGRGDRFLDLPRANTLNMLEAGVREENILRVGGCTCCDGGYFSYRREGSTGRQGTFICIRHIRR
ncbi:MAG: peptidoglycan editing factor PgeF [Actinomycetota bacterium]|nr:peptidoglycan editing factor PgeF [Actinomycetota bacterium]MDD5665821.1 peptidoglycan editing factor PgeF [Actinomycetota bacterium]